MTEKSLRRVLRERNASVSPVSQKEKERNRRLPPMIPYLSCEVCLERAKETSFKEGSFQERQFELDRHIFRTHGMLPVGFNRYISADSMRRLLEYHEALKEP